MAITRKLIGEVSGASLLLDMDDSTFLVVGVVVDAARATRAVLVSAFHPSTFQEIFSQVIAAGETFDRRLNGANRLSYADGQIVLDPRGQGRAMTVLPPYSFSGV